MANRVRTVDANADEVTEPGVLMIVATPIGNLGDLSSRAASALVNSDLVCCEDTRHTGKMLNLLGLKAQRLISLNAHNEAARIREILVLLESGSTVALVSDAGTPLVSDPGERLVNAAIAAGYTVSAVPGPSAVVTALVLSGLPSARWSFEGFLARKGPDRRDQLGRIAVSGATSVIYEAPGRVGDTLADLAAVCGPTREVAVARELTKIHEEVIRESLAEAIARDFDSRGEYVIVVGPAPPIGAIGSGELESALRGLIEAGISRRDAVTAVEVLLDVAHREAYDAVLKLGGTA